MNIVWTWDVVRRIIEVLWLINIAFAVWTVFRSRRDIASTWAWLLVLTILPVVGFILYLFVGRQLSHDEIFSIQDEQKQLEYDARQKAIWDYNQGMTEAEERGEQRGLKQGKKEGGIQFLILDNLEEGFPKQKILQKLQRRFDLTEEQAEQYFEKFTSK